MGTHIRFNDDNYEPSNSEDDMDAEDLELLRKVRNKGKSYSDSEEEVFGVNSESDENESDIALSDVEGQGEEDDGIPDAKAWGKNKRHYYSTDYVDPDYDGFQGKDATMAEIEEEEARTLQNALAKSMDDDDFSLGFFGEKKDETDKTQQEEIIKSDVSSLSKRQKLQLLQKESPEFFGLVEDYEKKMTAVKDIIHPIIHLHRQNKIESGLAMDFTKTYYELTLNYCTNIYMYLLLKGHRSNVKNHPVVKRLYQYRQLLTQMDPVFDEIIKPQMELLISKNENQGETTEIKKKKTLKLLSKFIKKLAPEVNKDATNKLEEESVEHQHKKKKIDPKSILKSQAILKGDSKSVTFGDNNCGLAKSSDTEESGEENPEEDIQAEGDGEHEKRGITYQIAKNKGLTPFRKKELRNPRVKHRNKFRKAQIRRKGAVREVRTEMSRYGGEMSGIKSSVTKSIKIKT